MKKKLRIDFNISSFSKSDLKHFKKIQNQNFKKKFFQKKNY